MTTGLEGQLCVVLFIKPPVVLLFYQPCAAGRLSSRTLHPRRVAEFAACFKRELCECGPLRRLPFEGVAQLLDVFTLPNLLGNLVHLKDYTAARSPIL